MTDEERQKLCEWLRQGSRGWSGSQVIEPKMAQAADEIERLAKENGRLTQALIDKLAAYSWPLTVQRIVR
jgi:7-keto-8-aminopelargonate synthetase-like enzyme